MKTRFIKLSFLAAMIALAVGTVQAQAPPTRKKTKRSPLKENNSTKNKRCYCGRCASEGYHSKTRTGICC